MPMTVKEAIQVLDDSNSTWNSLVEAEAAFVKAGLKGLARTAAMAIKEAAKEPIPVTEV